MRAVNEEGSLEYGDDGDDASSGKLQIADGERGGERDRDGQQARGIVRRGKAGAGRNEAAYSGGEKEGRREK